MMNKEASSDAIRERKEKARKVLMKDDLSVYVMLIKQAEYTYHVSV